ncbi:hypothetical protein JKG47_19505, partial [Acidithiobacillus sp. MC6.1]|nr:hypothetical protein [Acidithiobacillus sp. MC6.1]
MFVFLKVTRTESGQCCVDDSFGLNVIQGVDNREPHQHWRAALGWTSPSGIGGG